MLNTLWFTNIKKESVLVKKSLSEMTTEELWRLFPIQLQEHQAIWKEWYQEEKNQLLCVLSDTIKIHHIGSTSVNDIWAKPIIDIMIEANLSDFNKIKSMLLDNGYLCMAETKSRIDFNKGYTPGGFTEKVFHLHLRKFGDNDELYFKDYLNDHPRVAKEYEKLKLSLWKPFAHDRDGYTEGKTAFVHEYTQKAIIKYGRIY